MAAVNEYLVLRQLRPDKVVLLSEVPAAPSSTVAQPPATVTLRLLVQCAYCFDDADAVDDVDIVENVACRVPLRELMARDGAAAAERAFREMVADLDSPTLRPEVETEVGRAAKHVRAWCAGRAAEEIAGIELRMHVVLLKDEFDDESGSDLDFSDVCGGRDDSGGQWNDDGHAFISDDDDDEDGGGAQMTARPYHGSMAREGGPSDGTLLLSGFVARSDGPELSDQHELTPRDMQRLVRLALHGDRDVESDEAYQRALAGGTPVSPAARATQLDQALQSARRTQSQTTSAGGVVRWMRTGF
ncbi:hypothetical protein ABZP36_017936 [Zizania latifolia]